MVLYRIKINLLLIYAFMLSQQITAQNNIDIFLKENTEASKKIRKKYYSLTMIIRNKSDTVINLKDINMFISYDSKIKYTLLTLDGDIPTNYTLVFPNKTQEKHNHFSIKENKVYIIPANGITAINIYIKKTFFILQKGYYKIRLEATFFDKTIKSNEIIIKI